MPIYTPLHHMCICSVFCLKRTCMHAHHMCISIHTHFHPYSIDTHVHACTKCVYLYTPVSIYTYPYASTLE